MNNQEKVRDALADFHGLISAGWETQKAIVEAATSNEVSPTLLEARLKNHCDLESVVEDSRRKAELEKLNQEITSVVRNPRFNKRLTNIFLDPFDLGAAQTEIERAIGRELTETEVVRLRTARTEFRRAEFARLFGM